MEGKCIVMLDNPLSEEELDRKKSSKEMGVLKGLIQLFGVKLKSLI